MTSAPSHVGRRRPHNDLEQLDLAMESTMNSFTRRLVCPFALGLMLVVGCGGPEGETRHLEDEGEICFGDEYAPGEDRSHLEADEPLVLTVLFSDCVGGCDEAHEGSCSIEESGNTVTVTSQGSYTEQGPPPGGTCTMDCRFYTTTCEGPVLGEGTYELEHGDDIYEFTVPGDGEESRCLDDPNHLR